MRLFEWPQLDDHIDLCDYTGARSWHHRDVFCDRSGPLLVGSNLDLAALRSLEQQNSISATTAILRSDADVSGQRHLSEHGDDDIRASTLHANGRQIYNR